MGGEVSRKSDQRQKDPALMHRAACDFAFPF
jgi:hypothetical protein